MITALIFGLAASSALVIGAVIGSTWAAQRTGVLLAFASGALISALAFELFEEAFNLGGATRAGLGLLAGAAVFVAADSALDRYTARRDSKQRDAPHNAVRSGVGLALLAAVTLDGVPENLALGVSLVEGTSWALLVAIFSSNLPASPSPPQRASSFRSCWHSDFCGSAIGCLDGADARGVGCAHRRPCRASPLRPVRAAPRRARDLHARRRMVGPQTPRGSGRTLLDESRGRAGLAPERSRLLDFAEIHADWTMRLAAVPPTVAPWRPRPVWTGSSRYAPDSRWRGVRTRLLACLHCCARRRPCVRLRSCRDTYPSRSFSSARPG